VLFKKEANKTLSHSPPKCVQLFWPIVKAIFVLRTFCYAAAICMWNPFLTNLCLYHLKLYKMHRSTKSDLLLLSYAFNSHFIELPNLLLIFLASSPISMFACEKWMQSTENCYVLDFQEFKT